MNNRRKVYRVEHRSCTYQHSNIGVGPYAFFNYKCNGWDSPAAIELQKLMYGYEPTPYHFPDASKRPSFLGKLTMPTSDRWIRPGPREDMLLRDYFRENYLVDKNNISGALTEKWWKDWPIFAFDSMEQLNRWFFCDKEKQLLWETGFVIQPYTFKDSEVIRGQTQCLCKTTNSLYRRELVFKPFLTVPSPTSFTLK